MQLILYFQARIKPREKFRNFVVELESFQFFSSLGEVLFLSAMKFKALK